MTNKDSSVASYADELLANAIKNNPLATLNLPRLPPNKYAIDDEMVARLHNSALEGAMQKTAINPVAEV